MKDKTMPKKAPKTIEEATDIMVAVLAESVVEQVLNFLTRSNQGHLITNHNRKYYAGYLEGQAETIYRSNPSFRKKVNSNANYGNSGRDYLYIFMQHWLCSKLLKDNSNSPALRRLLVDTGFSTGR